MRVRCEEGDAEVEGAGDGGDGLHHLHRAPGEGVDAQQLVAAVKDVFAEQRSSRE